MSEWKPTAEWLHNYASGHAGFDDELAARLHACANELLKLGTALTALREIAGDEGCQTITVEMRIARDALEGLSDG